MKKRDRLSGFLPAALLLGAVVPAVAAPAIPVYKPWTITGPGVYQVTNDIVSSGAPAITVTGVTGKVEIDLGGYTLATTGGHHVIDVSNVEAVEIYNGRLVEATMGSFDGLRVVTAQEVIVKELEIRQPYDGIHLAAVDYFEIWDCDVLGAQNDGIYVTGTGASVVMEGKIFNSDLRNSGNRGIVVSKNHTDVVVRYNTVNGTSNSHGIFIEEGTTCYVGDNRVHNAAMDGIALLSVDNGDVDENISRSNLQAGIRIEMTTNTWVEQNRIEGNSSNGLEVIASFQNEIWKNTVRLNGVGGIFFDAGSSSNTYRDNWSRQNTSAPSTCGSNPPCAAPKEFCDDGSSNVSGTGNMIPGAC